MSKDSRRRWTAQQKLAIVDEVRKGGASVSGVCRKHDIAPTLFYEWENKIKQAAVEALTPQKQRRPQSKDPTNAEAEIQRLKGIIAEIAEENLKLKKGLWP
ncbi:MAG: transposase [Fimbriimonadaceae bacterium]|nr:transposase [Fimbriimonadaceae bacterium]